ncbi:MAG: hypothetical protein OHM77_01585 [Candidatus Nitricoxidivorans perseverans]|uniref:Dicarboxylate transport domain-containing protein n=1 Tax=Candidatus Nitricoxidivorans perseverans TaxID=2975601 RepID=A0AA49FMI3_9PROT|nr:MAG: hypothetical protein OHM77_01585 [Candidatus Nitricoxidivorans perseverans]
MPFRAVLPALTFLFALPCDAAQITLSLDSLRHPAFEADGITVHLDAFRPGEADIRIARLKAGSFEYRDVSLHCAGFSLDAGRIDCPKGQIRRESRRGGERPPLPFSFSWRQGEGRIDLAVEGADASAWSPLIRRLRAWKPEGRTDLRLTADRRRAEIKLAFRNLRFAGPKGGVAAEGMSVDIVATAQRTDKGWSWQATLNWPEGTLRADPWVRKAGVASAAQGTLTDAEWSVDLARLDLAGIGGVTASLLWDRERGEPVRWGFVTERLDLATAVEQGVQPWLATLGFPAWRVSGRARFAAEWEGALKSFYAGLEGAQLADGTGFIELHGVEAHIPWEAGVATDASFGIASARFGDLPLGGFTLPMRLSGREARVGNASAPLLDGRFEIEDLRVERLPAGWRGEFAGGIEGVSMPRLSKLLKLPRMEGSLTARIPRIAYADGVLVLDGALGIEVFDGGIIAHRLRVLDPFSAGRRTVLDVTARDLDLGMLTRTFAFGSIEGRFNADIADLEMVGWQPVRFAARIDSSPGDHLRLLSLGALQDITALGEEKEGRLARRIPERSVGGFGYARIGVGLALRDGVCRLDGIPGTGDDRHVVLMEGRGIPSINILGYNRRIDWEAMLARIRAVIAGKSGADAIVIE